MGALFIGGAAVVCAAVSGAIPSLDAITSAAAAEVVAMSNA
jgi:hypothetical protein